MTPSYGPFNVALTIAVRRLSATDSRTVKFTRHAERAMDDDDFDHSDVMECLKKGAVHGPEIQNGELRANVIHRGRHIRVAIGGLDSAQGDWAQLKRVVVISVMRTS